MKNCFGNMDQEYPKAFSRVLSITILVFRVPYCYRSFFFLKLYNLPAKAIGLKGPIGATDCANEFNVLDIDIGDVALLTCGINGKFGNALIPLMPPPTLVAPPPPPPVLLLAATEETDDDDGDCAAPRI